MNRVRGLLVLPRYFTLHAATSRPAYPARAILRIIVTRIAPQRQIPSSATKRGRERKAGAVLRCLAYNLGCDSESGAAERRPRRAAQKNCARYPTHQGCNPPQTWVGFGASGPNSLREPEIGRSVT